MWKGGAGIIAELVEVECLGTFLEVETLREDLKKIDLEKVKVELRAVIESCGLAEEDIEPNPYSLLLGMSGY